MIDDASAKLVLPALHKFVRCLEITLICYLFLILLDIPKACALEKYVNRITINKMQKIQEFAFPLLIFSMMNILFYGNFIICTILTIMILCFTILKFWKEEEMIERDKKQYELYIYGCVCFQFAIFMYTDHDKL